jgi:hypothetical protein
MTDAAGRYMKQAAAQLQALDGTLDRAREGAEEFQAEATEIQEAVRDAARRANDLASLMRPDSA